MLSALVPRVPAVERLSLAACVVLLAGAAWLGLGFSPDSRFFHLHHLELQTMVGPSFILYFVGGWTVMTVAMMLPSTLPVLATLQTFAANRPDRILLLALAILGYLVTWGSFGGVVYVGFLFLKSLIARLDWIATRLPAGGPLLVLVAGAFQFSELKHKCLEKCRSPFSFVVAYWRGDQERWHSFRLGVDHGIFCVGCCWALMLLMFAVGTGSLPWMMVLAIGMTVEKSVRWGRRISRPIGIALLTWGTILILR